MNKNDNTQHIIINSIRDEANQQRTIHDVIN